MSTDFITTPLALMMDRATEWRTSERLIIFNGDVANAFNMPSELVAKAMTAAGIDPAILAAIVSENLHLQCHPQF